MKKKNEMSEDLLMKVMNCSNKNEENNEEVDDENK